MSNRTTEDGFSLIELLIVVAIIGIIAAIAIPSLLRARISANEAAAIGDIRTVISSEAAYHASNGGMYDLLPCLAAPSTCIPGYPLAGPTFLDPQIASLVAKQGYDRLFTPGIPPAVLPSSFSPSSIPNYAYVAVPTSSNTGVRGFAGDASGRICQTMNGTDPAAGTSSLAAACAPL
jgi:prepilin-type N-terminal cleavage/methylation domain-containing protein